MSSNLGQWTVLVGPNNEGKSNLLRAMALALSSARTLRARWIRTATGGVTRMPAAPVVEYKWVDDYPIGLQELNPDGESVFRLWFALSDAEKREFADLLVPA